MLSDQRYRPIIAPKKDLTFEQWLGEYIGKNNTENGQIAVLDLSLIPSDVLHTVVAVIGRIIFEAIQRYRKTNQVELPTTIVLEEAHSFIKSESSTDTEAIRMCLYRTAPSAMPTGMRSMLRERRSQS